MSERYIDTGRKKQKLKTRTKIIACAQSFVTKGKKFSLEDIAKEAGLSRATIYRYYSNVELLAEEAGLDLDIESPEEIYNQVRELSTKDKILKTQEFFNHFTLRNEAALRRFLSVVIAGEEPESKRGARRSRSLELVLKASETQLDETTIENLTNIGTVLMGMEAMIVAKDVCRLGDQESVDLLRWGLEKILQAVLMEE